jgi:aspartyl-tRNA(Asn)/glutamyl-tRNA(Gln) amidotransferase subunit C
VRKVASLSRLALSEDQVEEYRTRLSAVLGYVERLRELELTGVEPLWNPVESTNRLFDDVPGPTLGVEALMALLPEGGAMRPYIKVPKVLGEGGGA